MQTQSHTPPNSAEASPRPVPRKPEACTASAWKPQDVGLSRQELRDIVIDLIG